MRRYIAMLAITLAFGSAGNGSAEVPQGGIAMALADEGVLMCFRPDVRRKTCQTIGSYERIREGIYNSYALLAVGSNGTLETQTPVWVKGEALCGSIREQDVMAGTLRVREQAIAPDRARTALSQIARQLAPVMDTEICTWFERSGDDYIAKSAIAGEYRSELDVAVRLIGTSDGYKVTP